MLNDRKIKLADIVSYYDIFNESVYTITHEHLGMSKYQPCWYPETWTCRIVSKGWSQVKYNANLEDIQTHLVTGNETRYHHKDPDTKTSMHWKHLGHPTQEISHPTISRRGNRHDFCDSKGIILIHVDYKPVGTSIT